MKILVIIEHDNKLVKQSSYSTITAASQIGDEIEAIIIGENLQDVINDLKNSDHLKKINYIDNKIFNGFLAENVSNAVIKFVEGKNFTHILSPASTFGKNLLPKISARLDVQQISDITAVVNDDTFERPIYAGNAIAKVKSSDKIKVITVRSTCFEPCKRNSNLESEEFNLEPNLNESISFLSYDQSKSDRPELTSAKIIISGGRGMQNGENFKLLEGIADKLGAAMGASRAAVDAGFVPNDWQVGQTGKIVAPDLYIAVGISGAIQHIAGIKDSKFIACINKDEEAPIFKFSDYGLVGDLFDVLPKLEEKL
ncbi:MAG: FAD-binding protein [Pseudomonadota bacterium]|nr:FAD-binding protein [Pseudomonadota bacterium]